MKQRSEGGCPIRLVRHSAAGLVGPGKIINIIIIVKCIEISDLVFIPGIAS